MVNILRKVVTEKNGTASLADINGFNVGGKTGTSQNYKNKSENLNTFISIFHHQTEICIVSYARKSKSSK